MFSLKRNLSGFTLIELAVAVVIISILAAISVPVLFRSVETTHASEATMWLGNVVYAQQRYQARRGGKYATFWAPLDILPSNKLLPNDVSINTFCTKDDGPSVDGNCTKDGFKITLYGANMPDAGVIAQRVNNGRYSYKLARFYGDNTKTLYCAAGAEHPENDRDMCALILGLETYDPDMEYAIVRIENASSEVSAPSTDEEE